MSGKRELPKIGSRVSVYWESFDAYFSGKVVGTRKTDTWITYDDGDEQILDLSNEVWNYENETQSHLGKGVGQEVGKLLCNSDNGKSGKEEKGAAISFLQDEHRTSAAGRASSTAKKKAVKAGKMIKKKHSKSTSKQNAKSSTKNKNVSKVTPSRDKMLKVKKSRKKNTETSIATTSKPVEGVINRRLSKKRKLHGNVGKNKKETTNENEVVLDRHETEILSITHEKQEMLNVLNKSINVIINQQDTKKGNQAEDLLNYHEDCVEMMHVLNDGQDVGFKMPNDEDTNVLNDTHLEAVEETMYNSRIVKPESTKKAQHFLVKDDITSRQGMNTLFGPTDKMSGEQRARGGEARKGTSISPELIKKRKTSIDLQKNNGSLTENEVLTNNSVAKLLKISEVRQDVSKKPVFSRKVNIELKQDTIRETQNVQNEYKTDDFDFVFYGEGVNDKSEMTLIQDSQNCHRKKKQGEENVKDACNVENVAKPKNIEVCSKDIKQLAREGRLAFDLHVVQDDNNVGKTNFALGGEDKNDMTQNVQDADEADNTGFLFGKKDIYGKNEMTLIQESQHFQKKQLEQGEKKLQNICNVENAQNAKDIETSVEYIRKHAIKENQSYDLHVVQEENYVGKKNLLHDGKDENHINQSVQDVHAVEYDGLEWKRKGRHGESEMNSIQDSQNFQKNKVKQGKKNMTDMCNAQNDQNIQDAKDIKTCAKDVRQHNRKESCSFDLHVVQGDYVRKENVLQNEKDKNYMIQNVQNVDEADDNHFDCSEGNMNDENEIILTQDSLGLKKRNYKQCEENMKDACNVENALNMTDMEVTPGEDRQDRQDSKIGEKKICSQIGQEMRIMQNVQKKLGENSITFKESKLSRNNSHQVLVASPPAKCKLESITMNPVDLNKKEQQSSEKMRKGSPVSNSNIRRRTDQKPVMMSLLVKEVDSGRFNSMERFIGIPSDKCVHCKKTDGNLWHCSFCVNSFHLECYGKYRNFYPPKKEDGFLCHVCCRKVLHIVRRKKGRQNKRQRLKSNIEKKQKLKRRSLTDWRTVDPLISDSPNGPSNPNGEGQDPSNFSEGESRNADTHQSIIWGKRRVLSREEEESLLSDTVNNHKISYSCPLGGPGGLICCADCASAYSAQLTKVARKIELKSAETAALELKLLNDDLEESRRRLFRVIELHNVNNLRRELT